MSRYRQQVKRALAERAAENAKALAGRERRTLRAGQPIPSDTVVGEVFDLEDADGRLIARVRWNGGPAARALQVVTVR